MVDKIKEYIQSENLIEMGESVTLGVSGGADSVALLLSFLEIRDDYDLNIDVIHINHGLRGEDARNDALFVESLCKKLDVPCQVFEVDVNALVKNEGLSVEEAARQLRYGVFTEHAAPKLVIAQHMDDNAETVLMQLLRGTGLSGLGGINPISNAFGLTIIRPLLCVRKSEIEEYLAENEQDYCTDETNFDNEYTRNKIRNEIFPLLEEINHKAIEHINHTASIMRAWDKDVELSAAMVVEEAASGDRINKERLMMLPEAFRNEAIKCWLEKRTDGGKDIGKYHIEEATKLLSAQVGKSIDLPGKYRVICDYEYLSLVEENDIQEEEEFLYEVKIPRIELGEVYEEMYGDYNIYFAVLENTGDDPPRDDYVKWIDYDKIKDDLVIRHRKEGDYIYINSTDQKSFSRYCIDEKIPREERDEIPLICCGDHVLWSVGYRLSEGAKINSDTKEILSIEVTGL